MHAEVSLTPFVASYPKPAALSLTFTARSLNFT